MNTAHTPGPWVWEFDAGHKQQTLVAGGEAVILHLDRRDRNTVGVNAPDAALIAVAPEMLEALKNLADAVEYWGFDRTISTIDARAAIAKATGGGK